MPTHSYTQSHTRHLQQLVSRPPVDLDRPLVHALRLRVQEHPKQRNARANGVLRRQRVVECDDARHNHDHTLHTVAYAVGDGGHAGEDHVGELLVGVEADAS